jgi:two-component system response regulator CssR
MYTIYLVEDEERLRKVLLMYLEKEGYIVKTFSNAEDAIQHLNDKVSLWLLDITLPGIDGIELLKKIRNQDCEVPIIFTSARDSEMDRVIGLYVGSDDYVTKPFSVNELLLRIKNILKRVYKDEATQISHGAHIIDLSNRTVFNKDIEVNLTSKEFDLLDFFLKRRQKAISRDEILNLVWGEDYYGTDRVVDDTIRRLRKKMVDFNIETIYGYGYRLL